MNADSRVWLSYAEENLEVARLSFGRGLLNPCLQNAQQCVEKALKAAIVDNGLQFRKTHNIRELAGILTAAGLDAGNAEDEGELLDSLYVPSKYPVVRILPDYIPDRKTSEQCVDVAARVLAAVRRQIGDQKAGSP